MSEAEGETTTATKPKRVRKPPAAKTAAPPAAKKKKTAKVKTFIWGIVEDNGVIGSLSAVYGQQDVMMDDISLTAAGTRIVIYRESRRGQLKTKARLV